MAIGAGAVSFVVGAAVGFFTANPAIGIGVGILVGACLGTGAAAIIISNTYDVHQDRTKVLLSLMFGCALAGGCGGAVGGYLGIDYFIDFLPYHFAGDYCWGETIAWTLGTGILSTGVVGLLYNCVLS